MKLKMKVPLIGGEQLSLDTWFKNFTVYKPGRRLGGGWMADRVAERKPINLCPSCVHKYGRWYKQVDYEGDWDFQWMTDCDGCGDHIARYCTGFYPEETARQVMCPSLHFKAKSPHHSLFSFSKG